MSWLRRGTQRRQKPLVHGAFAEDVLSNVTSAECSRLAQLATGRRVLEIG